MAENNYENQDKKLQGYTHVAFADSPDGAQGFTTGSNYTDKRFVGFLVDNSSEDSQNPSDYTWADLANSPHDEPGPAGEEGVRVPLEPKPNLGKKRIPKWAQWVIVIMVTGAIGFSFAGIAAGVVLWFVFDWINGDL